MTAQAFDEIRYKGSEFSVVAINGKDWFDPYKYSMNPVYRTTSCRRGFCSSYRVENNQLFLDTLDINLSYRDDKWRNGENDIGLESAWEAKSEADDIIPQEQLPNKKENATSFSETERLLELIRDSKGDEDDRDWVNVQAPKIEGRPAEHTKDRDSSFEYRYENMSLPVFFSGGILVGGSFIQSLYVHMGYHPAWKFRVVRELTFQKGILLKDRNQSPAMAKLRLELAPNNLEKNSCGEFPQKRPTKKDSKAARLIQQVQNAMIRVYSSTVPNTELKSLIEKYDIETRSHINDE